MGANWRPPSSGTGAESDSHTPSRAGGVHKEDTLRFPNSAARSPADRSGVTALRLVATAFAIVFGASCLATLTGCDRNLPTAPPVVTAQPPPVPPPVSTSAHVRGTVVGAGHCIDATLEILDGPQAGQRAQQNATECLENEFYSYSLDGLSLGTGAIRIRASATGFQSQERSYAPEGNNASPQMTNADFYLERSPS